MTSRRRKSLGCRAEEKWSDATRQRPHAAIKFHLLVRNVMRSKVVFTAAAAEALKSGTWTRVEGRVLSPPQLWESGLSLLENL